MNARPEGWLLIVSRSPLLKNLPFRGRLRLEHRMRVSATSQALTWARNAKVSGIFVDLDFEDGGVDGMELALLLAELNPEKPVWVVTSTGNPRLVALSKSFSKLRRAAGRGMARRNMERSRIT